MKNLDETLGRTINFGKASASLAPTDKQIKTLKGLIYDYKITVKDDVETNTRQGISRKISEIYNAIKAGKVKKRESRPTNSSVRRVDGYWRLVINEDINDFKHVVNGFGQFIEEENERQNKYFMQQHEEWLNKQETKANRKAKASANA